jgi:hypothetical protein
LAEIRNLNQADCVIKAEITVLAVDADEVKMHPAHRLERYSIAHNGPAAKPVLGGVGVWIGYGICIVCA